MDLRRTCIFLGLLLVALTTSAEAQAAAPAAVPAPAPAAAQADGSSLRATYLTNEGFLLEAGGRKVLVDALVGDNPLYITLSRETRRQLEAAEGPFADVDLVLATHFHADHFDADAVRRYLLANPKATFVSTPQAVAALARLADFPALQPRVRTSLPAEGQRQRFEDLDLEVLNLHHGRNRKPLVENLGFVIHLEDFKVLHVGDTEATAREFDAYGLLRDDIDLALLPEWIVYDSHWRGLSDRVIQPKHLLAMHLQTSYPADYGDRIRNAVPGVLVPGRELETFVVSRPSPEAPGEPPRRKADPR